MLSMLSSLCSTASPCLIKASLIQALVSTGGCDYFLTVELIDHKMIVIEEYIVLCILSIIDKTLL